MSDCVWYGIHLNDYRRALRWHDAETSPGVASKPYTNDSLKRLLDAGQTERNKAVALIKAWKAAGSPTVSVRA